MTGPRLELRSAARWDGPETAERQSSGRFRVAWTTIRDHLLYECDQLGAPLVVVQLVIDPSGLRNDGKLRANAKVLHPGVKVLFESNHGPLAYATDVYAHLWGGTLPGWQANLRAIGLTLEALRAVNRYGTTTSGEQYRGFAALTAAPAGQRTMTLAEATAALAPFATGSLTHADNIRAAWRDALKVHHVDRGGSTEAMQLIDLARKTLLAAL